MIQFKLFCLPYAGGSSAIFNKWRQHLDRHIEIVPLELSGRGRRIYDPLYNSIDDAVEDLFPVVTPHLDGTPYAIFGHSLGSMISYRLALKLAGSNQPQPAHVFFSGRGAPHVANPDEEMVHQLPEEEFKKEIIQLGGTPREFFDHPELLDVLLPMLRSDFKMAETYETPSQIKPFDYDISVFIGKQEEVTPEQMFGWKDHTSGICTLYYFEGEHFFINEKTETIVTIINRTLLRDGGRPGSSTGPQSGLGVHV